MVQTALPDITQLLLAWRDGDEKALESLTPLVYGELHRLAKSNMRRQRPGHTLQTTALVNEAYLRLVDSSRVNWQNRAHFFAVAAQLMRRILVDFARSRQSLKRGGMAQQVSFEQAFAVANSEQPTDVVALDEALKNLARLNERQSLIVELRYFGGLSEEEIAHALEVSARTVRRDWSLARAWLYRELNQNNPQSSFVNQ